MSSAQDQISCDSEFNFFGVDMDENDGEGTTNSTYEWAVLESEFEGEIQPQTASGNQILIEWQNTPNGTYTVVVQEINGDVSCLPDPQEMLVKLVNHSPEDILGPDVICEGETLELEHPRNGRGQWSLQNSKLGDVSPDGICENLQVGRVRVNFDYEVGGCSFSVSKLIQVNPQPKPKLEDSEICVDRDSFESVTLDSGLSQEGHEFRWHFNGQRLEETGDKIEASEIGEYQLQVINTETGCSSSLVTTKVSQIANPIVTATASVDFNDQQSIEVNISNPERYLFKLEDGKFQDSPRFHNITTEGVHHISILEKEGCFSKEIEVIVINYPKFFSPNDDGINDTWNILSLENDPTAEVFIFDRYGKLLKVISPARDKGWNGTYNGKRMPTDDYWFLVEYEDDSDGGQRTFRSHFTLKR